MPEITTCPNCNVVSITGSYFISKCANGFSVSPGAFISIKPSYGFGNEPVRVFGSMPTHVFATLSEALAFLSDKFGVAPTERPTEYLEGH